MIVNMSSKELITQKILNAALHLVNRFGYGSLGLSELARQARITKQRLYYHFPTPEDVIVVLAEEWSRTGQKCTLEALAKSHEVGSLKVLAMSEGMFDWMRHHEELSKLGLALHQSSPHIKKLQNFMENARKAGRERIKSFLLQDEYYKNMKARQLEDCITSLHSFMYGFYFYVVALNDFKNLDIHEKNCREGLIKILSARQE